MSEVMALPYFEIEERKISYLKQFPYLDLDGLTVDSPAGERFLLAEGIFVKKPCFPNLVVNSRKILALEPHPDDVALSSSGYLMRSIEAGDGCHVMNLFSKTAIERFPWNDKVDITKDQLEALRLQESHIAITDFLGQHFTSLRLPLASMRGYSEIFADKHNDQDLVKHIGNNAVKTIAELDVNVVLSPLAVQGHIDHLVTFDVGMYIKDVMGSDVDLVLYEDYPYVRNKDAYDKRLQVVKSNYSLDEEYVPVDPYLAFMADMAIIYRSQFDDINRDQMHALMREDFRATALEANARGFSLEAECAQRYWKVL